MSGNPSAMAAHFRPERVLNNTNLLFNQIYAFPFFLSFFFLGSDGALPGPDIPGIPAIFGIPGIPGRPCCACISFIASLNELSLTPPPVKAGECNGKTLLIFHPRGVAGGPGGFSGTGMPCNLSLKGDCSVVGCDCRYCAT